MSHWETRGHSDEWYTPEYIFDALGCVFDVDVASPPMGPPHVPCRAYITDGSLDLEWSGFVWMNPPFGGRNGLIPWLKKFFHHRNGIALVPDRTSAPWWHDAAATSDALLFINGKVKFIRPDGSLGKSPSSGTVLIAAGLRAVAALQKAEKAGLGLCFTRHKEAA